MRKEIMKHRKLVLPEYMNDKNVLFGGYLLKWIDEVAYITAKLDYPGNKFVTICLDNVVFKKPIHLGYILCFEVQETKIGRTSITYHVKVYNDKEVEENRDILFETNIVFVNVGDDDKKKPILK